MRSNSRPADRPERHGKYVVIIFRRPIVYIFGVKRQVAQARNIDRQIIMKISDQYWNRHQKTPTGSFELMGEFEFH